MGCALSEDTIETDLKYAPPDFNRSADPKRTFMNAHDFSCRFEPMLFAEIFKQNTSIQASKFSLPPLGPDKDKY